MKITCTAAEKELLVAMLAGAPDCPFDRTTAFRCNFSDDCETCVGNNIEWEITPEP